MSLPSPSTSLPCFFSSPLIFMSSFQPSRHMALSGCLTQLSLYPALASSMRLPRRRINYRLQLVGPFLSHAKRGAHMPPFLLAAREGFTLFEKVYGAANLANAENWYARGAEEGEVNVRILTVAPEVEGVMSAVKELSGRGMVVAIGHRLDMVLPPSKTRFWELMLDERWHTAPPARKSQPPRS